MGKAMVDCQSIKWSKLIGLKAPNNATHRTGARWCAGSFKLRLSECTRSFTITEEAPTRAFSLLKAKRLLALSYLRHY